MWTRLYGWIAPYRTQLALCSRVTIAALATLILAKLLGVSMILWAVLTAVLLTQMSVGRSVKATIDYTVGTLGGTIYAGLVTSFIPHTDDVSLAVQLAIALTPLAFIAAISSRYTVAPSTAVLVVLAPTLTHATPLASATEQVIEVALGAVVALIVSLVVFPARASVMVKEAAADMLDLIGQILPGLFAGYTQGADAAEITRLQRTVGAAFARLDAFSMDVRHEKKTAFFADELDFNSLRYNLLRIRHDLIIIGRSAVTPLPLAVREKLGPPLSRIEATAAELLRSCAQALRTGRDLPRQSACAAAFDTFAEEIVAIRSEGGMRSLSIDDVELIFALAFALEQWHGDLQRLSVSLTRGPRVDDLPRA